MTEMVQQQLRVLYNFKIHKIRKKAETRNAEERNRNTQTDDPTTGNENNNRHEQQPAE